MFQYSSPVNHPQVKIFNNSYTVLHLVIACVTDMDSPEEKGAGCDRVQYLQWPVTGIWLPHPQIHQNLVQFLHPQIPLVLGVCTQPVSAQKKTV